MNIPKQIESSIDTNDLDQVVENAAFINGIQLDQSLSYGEQAEIFENSGDIKLETFAQVLRDADSRFFQLEG